jgi:hypothetical protein
MGDVVRQARLSDVSLTNRTFLSKDLVVLITFLLILLLATYLRLAMINLAEFKSDEAGTAFVVKHMVQNGTIPLLGPGLTTGGNIGPIYYYILAIPFFFSENPVIASAFVALLNLVGLVVTFLFARKFFTCRIALITTALYSVSPFAILYSRKIWNPDISFPFVIIVMYCLYSLSIERKGRYIIPLFAAYAVLVETQPITIFLAPVLLYYVLKGHGLITLRQLALGILAGALALLPFTYGQVTTQSSDTQSFFHTFSYFYFNNVNPTVIGSISSLTSGSAFDYVLGQSAGSFYSSILNINNFFAVEDLLLYAGVALLLVHVLGGRLFTEKKGETKYSILLVWLAVPSLILLFFNPPYGLAPYEVMMFVPANFLVVAILFDYALSRISNVGVFQKSIARQKLGRMIVIAILISVILVQIGFDVGFNSFLARYGGTAGDYEIGVQYKIEVASYIAQNSNGSSFTISYNLTPGQIGLEYYYLLSMYDKTASTSANLHYIVVNNLSNPSQSFLSDLSGYQSRTFGPLTVYDYTQ